MFINAENWPRPRHGRKMTKQIPNAVSRLASAPRVGPPLFASGSIIFFFFFFQILRDLKKLYLKKKYYSQQRLWAAIAVSSCFSCSYSFVLLLSFCFHGISLLEKLFLIPLYIVLPVSVSPAYRAPRRRRGDRGLLPQGEYLSYTLVLSFISW